MYLPDINVWIALAFPQHEHYAAARVWFDGSSAGRPWHFCRFAQIGFLRLANNRKVFPQSAVTQDVAWKLYDDFLCQPRIAFAPEPPTLELMWRQFTQLPRFSPNTWNDAYLAAFAKAGGYEIVTFDNGFTQYPGLLCTILS